MGHLESLGSFLMAPDTDGVAPGAQHRIGGFPNKVVSMADLALRKAHPVVGRLVRAVNKKIAREGMTLGADISDRNRLGPGGIVATMTAVAGGGGPVAAL